MAARVRLSENMSSLTNSDFGRKYHSPSRRLISQSAQSPMSSMTLPSANTASLNSTERRHYNRALKELCKILRLDSQRIDDTFHPGIDDEESSFSRKVQSVQEDLGQDEDSSLRASDDLSESPCQLYESEEYLMSRHSHKNIKKRSNWEKPASIEMEAVDRIDTVKDVYAELAAINRKLQQHQSEINKWKLQLEDKNKENRRQKSSFDTLKHANDNLRKQLTEIQDQNKKLESQAVNVQNRLANLQRKQELSERQRVLDSVSVKAKAESRKQLHGKDITDTSKTAGQTKNNTKQATAVYDVLGVLLEWLSEVHLRNVMTEDCIKQPLIALPTPALTKERCIKILPSLVEVLHCLPAANFKMHLPCLQFIYWSLVHLDQGQGSQQRNPLSSTYRRLGEELYKPTVVRFAGIEEDFKILDGLHEKPKAAVFFRSPNLHIRLLSCLIIMKTLCQVDYLAQVFDVLKTDLKEESAKEWFLRYQATPIVIPFLKMTNKALTGSAIDVFLQMSMESVLTQEFLDSCSTDTWFRACATVLRTPNLDSKTWEKLSIILQKLSKIKSNKRHFEVQGITSVVQEVLRTGGQENAFLSLNLRSILFNFNIAKRSPMS